MPHPRDTKVINNLKSNTIFKRVLEKFSGKGLKVFSPTTNEQICELRTDSLSEIDAKIQTVHENFSAWSETTAKERSKIIQKFGYLIEQNQTELAEILTAENGKPIAEAEWEAGIYGADICDWFAAEAKRTYGDTIPSGP